MQRLEMKFTSNIVTACGEAVHTCDSQDIWLLMAYAQFCVAF